MKKSLRTKKIEPKAPELEAIEILLVEDTDSDARRTLDALRDGKVRNRVVWVQDGEQALDLLHQAGTFAGPPSRPHPAGLVPSQDPRRGCAGAYQGGS